MKKAQNQSNFTSDQQEFITYLEKTTEEVNEWPKWKQNILGGADIRNEPKKVGNRNSID